MKLSKAETFPLEIKSGSVTVKVYRVKNRDRQVFTVSYIGASGRQRETFADLVDAKAAAKSKAESLSLGDQLALRLTGDDRSLYVAAVEALKPTGISLDVVAREFAAAWVVLGGHSILDAARHYERTVLNGLPKRTVADCVADYVAAKAAEGLSAIYVADRRRMLGHFTNAFACDLRDVTTDQLRKYVAGRKGGLVAKNNQIVCLRGLFNFSKAQGWLSRNETTAADGLGLAKIKIHKVAIYSPAEVAAILAAADEDYRAMLALVVLCGVRREESMRMTWDMIDFAAGIVDLPANITKTGRRRKIELQDAAKAFLAPYSERKGLVMPVHPERRQEKLLAAVVAKLPEFKWKKNALRHSYGSYRLEQCRNAGQVALEMGNSAQVVMRHYAEVVSAKDAKAYWAIRPAI